MPLTSPRQFAAARLSAPVVPSMLVWSALALALGAAAPEALACASCGCTLSKDWAGPQAGAVSGWSLGLSYDYINQNRFQQGTHDIGQQGAQAALNPPGNGGNEVELQTATRTTTLSADYNTDTWGVSVQLPFVDRYHTTLADGTDAGYDSSQFNQLGDVKVIGKYAGWSEDGDTGITVGVQLPTGATHENFASGAALDPSLQPGSGATAVLLGAFTSGMQGKLGWFAQGSWQHTVASSNGYTPGSAAIVNAGLRWAEIGQSVVPLLQLNLVHRNADGGVNASVAFDGTPMTGGNLAYLAPGVAVSLGSGTTGYAYAQLPVYADVNGVQLAPRYILSLGLRKFF